ncbi:hypothetical protein [Gellertiella hungarica]|uniref:Uncharacterized protein n=1 Tax=Gellertiella hungarica TaxID=1572859 RepID=A0A7W6J8K3_9HYPH|nr:hypothetical protein [Gellertiella hungarica]MBB4066806.1 hypothetical protein [Gellertiella hungarica]
MISDYLWFFAVAIGPVILGAVILYAVLRNRRLTPGERVARSEAVREMYTDSSEDRRT